MTVRQQDRTDETAVSPVIGVILMVAITVILAAVIGTFVLGLGDDVQETAQAGVNFDHLESDENLTIQVVDPGNVDRLVVRSTEHDGHIYNEDPGAGDSISLGTFSGTPPGMITVNSGDWTGVRADGTEGPLPDGSTNTDTIPYYIEGDTVSTVGVVGDDENLLDTYDVPE